MKLDRTIEPEIKTIDQIDFPQLQTIELPNGVSLHYLNMGDQDVVRIDLMFGAGRYDQDILFQAAFTNLLLKDGAGTLNSSEMAEKLDFYGAWLQNSTTQHYSYVTMYSLNRFFAETAKLLEMMVKEPHLPEHEFEILKENRKQQFMVERDRVQVLATEAFSKALWGEQHPYGRQAVEADFDKLSLDNIRDFHKKCYYSDNMRIFLSGKITEEMLAVMTELFGRVKWGSDLRLSSKDFAIEPLASKQVFVEKKNALQDSIRVGLPIPNRDNPDFYALKVLNTVLGGYFGSRLMTNIREEKGYTYGIGSAVASFRCGAYMYITTQTACEYSKLTMEEIYHEINKLHNELIPDEELEMVKNFMMGEFSRNLDGPFALADAFISLFANNSTIEFYQKQIEVTRTITAEELQKVARKYLKKEDMIEVVAGLRQE